VHLFFRSSSAYGTPQIRKVIRPIINTQSDKSNEQIVLILPFFSPLLTNPQHRGSVQLCKLQYLVLNPQKNFKKEVKSLGLIKLSNMLPIKIAENAAGIFVKSASLLFLFNVFSGYF
jgi:hypothetical protein